MERMKLLMLFHLFHLLLLIQLIRSCDVCSTHPGCLCTPVVYPYLSANCSNLRISEYPKFSNCVIEIDLSFNNLNTFPSCNDIPERLVSLNLSHNIISSFRKANNTCYYKFLRNLNLDSNLIEFKNLDSDVFKSLKNLSELNIKNNFGNYNNSLEYPEHIFSELEQLQSLKIDGLNNKGFGTGFGHIFNLTTLDMSGSTGKCNISFIIPGYFINLKHLINLDLSSCNILRIYIQTFSHMHYLQLIDISYNIELTFNVLTNLTTDLSNTSIKIAKLNKIHRSFGLSTTIFKEDMRSLKDTGLEVLEINDNRLVSFESGVIQLLPDTLHTISVNFNILNMGRYLIEGVDLKGLKVLKANSLYRGHLPNDLFIPQSPDSCDIPKRVPCDLHSSMIGTRLTLPVKTYHQINQRSVSGGYNSLITPSPSTHSDLYYDTSFILIPFPPNLAYFDVSKSDSRFQIPSVYFTANILSHLNLSTNFIHNWHGQVKNLKKLKWLDLSNNMCSYVSNTFFSDVKGLRYLFLQNNLLGFVLNNDSNGSILKHLVNLRSLDLSRNRIGNLPPNVFRGLNNLETLDLSNNFIRDWTFEIRHMRGLRYINLSGNQISYLSTKVRRNIDIHTQRTRNISLNLKENRLLCTCFALPFLNWLLQNSEHFVDFKSYSCKLENNTSITFKRFSNIIDYLETTCFSKTTLILSLSMGILFLIVIVISGVLYRYRWKLRYLYYLNRYNYVRNDVLYAEEEHDQFEFDAFISYADEDRHFVISELINHLEDIGDFRLCISDRDFVAGMPNSDNVTHAVNCSRKTLIILSEHFLKSAWCDFEFHMAHMESLHSRHGQPVIFVVLYGNIKMSSLPLNIIALMSTNTYAEYTTDEHGNILFWDKIQKALRT